MDVEALKLMVADTWRDELVPQLEQYIAIPALSPAFDPDWAANGHIEAAVTQIVDWIRGRVVAGMSVEVQRLEGLTPLIVVEIEPFGGGSSDTTVLLYGHLDKQPEMAGWREDLGPWKPVREGDKLYGRGGADDGYAAYASLTAIEAVQTSGGSHDRCVLLIEASEESGSPDLPAHVEALADRLGAVDLVLCLDSGCATYDTLWLTTSLRGVVMAYLTVEVVTEGLHSGGVSGLVPSSFRLVRQLLDRIEDAETGAIHLDSANVEIPNYRMAEAEATAAALGSAGDFPLVGDLQLMESDPAQGLLATTWRPALSYTGADGLPATSIAGNVLRPSTTLALSLRIPPTANPNAVADELKQKLTADPPLNATVKVAAHGATGWNAPDLAPWLADALEAASQASFGAPMQLLGEGGTIPFMGMLGKSFPDAQFVITGVLGPESNAHGPNEFLHVAYAERLTNCLAHVLHATSARASTTSTPHPHRANQ